MKEIKYYKTENIIEDTCIVYGMCKILENNFINYSLITKNSCYIIQYDESQLTDDGLIWTDLTESDCKSINQTYYTEIKKGALNTINNWFNGNIDTILKQSNDKQVLNKNDTGTIAIGTHFYTLSKSFKEIKTSFIKKNLAFYGYMTYTKLISCDTHDINFLMIPKIDSVISNIVTPADIIITKKDGTTFSKKNFDKTRGDNKSEINLEAIIYLKTLFQYYKSIDKYQSIFIMQYKKAGNKPMADKYYEVDVIKLSKEVYERLEKTINNTDSYDVKDSTSKFIISHKYKDFAEMMRIWSKKEQKIERRLGEEIINMFNEDVKKIYFNESVQRLGQGLSILTSDKKGFEILSQLYSVNNEFHISRIIRKLSDDYLRYKGRYLLNDNQVKEVLNLLQNKKDSKIMADAIITYSRNFYTKKENNANNNIVNNEGEVM